MDIQILFENEAQQALYAGITELTQAVASTLGPKGHTVMIDKGYGVPHITKDGVTVARAYDTNDPVKRMGSTLVKMVASKTCDEAGDGTTTATILVHSLLKEGMKSIPNVKNPQRFKEGMESACQDAVKYIKENSIAIEPTDFERLDQIALISANGDEEIAAIITSAIGKVGNDGVITVEESSKSNETSVEVTTGFQYERGLINPYFVTDRERMECVLDNPYVLVFGQNINYIQEILPIVQSVYTSKRSLLIIAPNMSEDVIKFLIMNIQSQGFKGCFVKAPGYGQIQKDLIEDLSTKLGALTIGNDYGRPVESMGTDFLGECDRAVINMNRTVILGGAGTEEDITVRVNAIKCQMESNTNTYDIEKFRDRISKLTGGAAVVYVGANSEVEMKERKDRVDDAIAATRAAITEGYVLGGGITHYRCFEHLQCSDVFANLDYLAGRKTVSNALKYPFRQLCLNAGLVPEEIEQLIKNNDIKNVGYNFKNESVEDFLKSGIIDPAKVTRVTLENAVSVAIQFLNTSCAMAILPESRK